MTRCPVCHVPTNPTGYLPHCSPRCYAWDKLGVPVLKEGYIKRQRLLNEVRTNDE